MSKETSHLTVSPRDSDEDVTFRAIIYEESGYTAISVMGPVKMVIDQIVVTPSEYEDEFKTDCGVSLNYRRTSEYHAHTAGHLVLGPDEERRLVEWLHNVGSDFDIETTEYRATSQKQASCRGKCAGCGAYFKDGHDWSLMKRQEEGLTLYYCDEGCLDE